LPETHNLVLKKKKKKKKKEAVTGITLAFTYIEKGNKYLSQEGWFSGM